MQSLEARAQPARVSPSRQPPPRLREGLRPRPAGCRGAGGRARMHGPPSLQAMSMKVQIGYPDYILDERSKRLDREYSNVRPTPAREPLSPPSPPPRPGLGTPGPGSPGAGEGSPPHLCCGRSRRTLSPKGKLRPGGQGLSGRHTDVGARVTPSPLSTQGLSARESPGPSPGLSQPPLTPPDPRAPGSDSPAPAAELLGAPVLRERPAEPQGQRPAEPQEAAEEGGPEPVSGDSTGGGACEGTALGAGPVRGTASGGGACWGQHWEPGPDTGGGSGSDSEPPCFGEQPREEPGAGTMGPSRLLAGLVLSVAAGRALGCPEGGSRRQDHR